MSRYPYDPGLKSPFPGPELTRRTILTDAYIRWCNFYNAVGCRAFRPQPGIQFRTLTVPVSDGTQISMYLLEPENCPEKIPAVFHCHGGAFFMDAFPGMLTLDAWLAAEGKCRVFMPRYRTSLDAPYPTPLNDCWDAWNHISNNADAYRIDTKKLMLYGDSAGGCLAAQVAQLSRDRNGPRASGQVLVYPVTDVRGEYPSRKEYAYGTWTTKSNEFMWELYLRNTENSEAHQAAPMGCVSCKDLPPAYVEPAEMDALRDEGIAYARRLSEDGVPVQMNIAPGAYHGFEGDLKSPYVQNWLKKRMTFIKSCWDDR